jgi:hypothetical protein
MKTTINAAMKTLSRVLASERLHHCTLVTGTVLAAGLLAALASTCQEQVQRGERLRAEQRMAPPVLVAAAPRQAR